MELNQYKIGIISTHPIQYYSPLYKAVSDHPEINLKVYYCHKQTQENHGESGFGVKFDWDIDLLDGYKYKFLNNVSAKPNVDSIWGCDTPEIYDEIKKEKFDAVIVSGWYVKSYIQAIWACWRTNTPVIVRSDSHLNTNRSFLRKIIKYPLYRGFIPRFDAYLYVGKRSLEYLLYYGANREKMFFSPHTVDNKYFKENSKLNSSKLESVKTNLNIPHDSIIFLFVGKLIDIKRPMDFLESIKISYKTNKNIFGIMAGEGELKSKCVNFIKNNNLPVRCLGFVNQSKMPEIYALSDILVVTSESETWGLVVNEAMASGLTAICSVTVGCVNDLIIEDETGIFYKKGDIKELAENMSRLLKKNNKLDEMKIRAQEHIQNYSVEKNVENIIKTLKYLKEK